MPNTLRSKRSNGREMVALVILLMGVGLVIPPGGEPNVTAQQPPSATLMAYVVNLSPEAEAGAVTVIDVARSAPVGSAIPVECGPNTIAASPTGRWLYVTNFCSDSVSILHVGRNAIVGQICLASVCPAEEGNLVNPFGIGVSADGGRILAARYGDFPAGRGAGISVINARTRGVIGDIPVPRRPLEVTVAPDGTKAYITHVAVAPADNLPVTDTVVVIDLQRNRVATQIPVGPASFSLALSPDGGRLYVPDWRENALQIIDTSSNTVITRIAVGNGPDAVGVSPDGSRVYVSHTGSDDLWVLDASTRQVIAKIPLGGDTTDPAPTRIGIAPDGSVAYVANTNNNTVTAIDLRTNTVIRRIPVGQVPVSVAIVARAPEVPEREPNNDLPQANPLSLVPDNVLVVKAAMTPATDVDLFAFDGRAGQQLVADVDAQALGTSIDTTLALLNAAGQVIAENNDFDGSKDPYLSVTLPSDGRYFLRVQLAARVTAFQSGYELVLTLR